MKRKWGKDSRLERGRRGRCVCVCGGGSQYCFSLGIPEKPKQMKDVLKRTGKEERKRQIRNKGN